VLGGAADDPRFATLAGRVEHHDEIDELVSAWTSRFGHTDAAARLQEVGVAAHAVLDNIGVLHDEQVRDRRWLQVEPSSRFPDGDVFSGHPIHLADEPGRWWRSGLSMGEDTVEVLTTRAGMSHDEVAALIDEGAAFTVASPEITARRPYIDYVEILLAPKDPA
jgi:crotonobetainyl-CoA:carnitine CoA-transferase CaiB-like acyl-CoA transferase